MELYLKLFLTFAKVGICTFGGGYAMLPVLQREIVENNGWATDAELSDYFAMGQCTPGIIAVNTATFVGCKQRGWLGGLAATLGVVFPSVVIIGLLAAFLSGFSGHPVVEHAFAGVRACVCVLILNSVVKLWKSTVIDGPTTLIFLAILALSLVGETVALPPPADVLANALLSPAALVLLAGLCGLGLKGGRT